MKSILLGDNNQAVPASSTSQITIFSYVWAAQTLVQLSYYRAWFEQGSFVGWAFFLLSLATFLFPGRIRLFVAMLISGLLYYSTQWPFVSNHTLLDSIYSLTILISFFVAFRSHLSLTSPIDKSVVDNWLAKFAPVMGVIFSFMYVSIIVSKLNYSFYDMEISCLTGMMEEAEANRPLVAPFLSLASTQFFHWFFIIVEVALPIMLLFRKTRLAAFYIGVPFHIVLGMMGHFPFSSQVIALYVLVGLPALAKIGIEFNNRIGNLLSKTLPNLSTNIVYLIINVALIGTAIVGKPSITWLAWTLILAAVLLLSVFREHVRNGLSGGTDVTDFWVKKPGIIWVMAIVAVMNSSGPYLGWKTHTSVAMYSNMRTEGHMNNHFFMPKVPIFGFQDDLVEIIDSNNPDVLALKTYEPTYGFEGQSFEVYRVYFEFRRFVSGLEDSDLEITYLRNGEMRTFRRGDSNNIDSDLDTPPPLLQRKFQIFRPVFKGEKVYCLH